MSEIWKDIDGYEGVFQVSSEGRIKSLQRLVKNRIEGTRVVHERIMSTRVTNSGYCLIHLSKSNKRKAYTVHRLVALSFIPNPENRPQVNHIDGNKENNRLENLEWVTRQENARHAWRTGKMENTREKARQRMSVIGKTYAQVNGDNLRKYYANKANLKG